ncbi:MAG: T9SS type A sorting domain-containing protein, partial [Bacteroidota bacterium]
VTSIDRSFRVNYRDVNGCISGTTNFDIEVVDVPEPTDIIGNFEICQGDEEGNVYDAGVEADSYRWSVAGGTIIGGSTNQTVTVNWTPGSNFANIEVIAIKESVSGTITCESDPFLKFMEIRSDVITYNLTQGNFLCEESAGSVILSGSQVGQVYVLYIDDERSNLAANAKIGTGSQLEWSGLAPFSTYTVNLETIECGSYEMDGTIVVAPDENDGSEIGTGEDVISTTPVGTVETGEPVIFESSVEADGYSWSFTGNLVSSDERPVMIFNMPDTTINVSLTLEYNTGCEVSYTVEEIITVTDTEGIFNIPTNSNETFEINVAVNGTTYDLYPNPSSTEVNFRFTSTRSEVLRVTVSDLKGTRINSYEYQVSNDALNKEVLTVPIEDVDPGVYVMKVEGTQFSEPIIVLGIRK